MAGAAAEGEAEQQLAGRVQRYPRDLLRQFSGGVVVPEETRPAASAGTEEEDSGEIELSLGLSLGGCFGVDPAQRRGLHRSPSVAAIPLLQQREHEYSETVPPLKRTYSLPAEAEEERRKRKELQCLRWTEPKRKKPEKSNGSWTWARDPVASPEEEGDRGGRRPEVDLDLRRWWAPNGTAAAGQAREGVRSFAAVSQRSVGSQGSSSSGVCDFANRPPKQQEPLGNGSDDWRSSSRIQSLPDLTEHSAPTVRKPLSCAAAREEEEEVDAPQKKAAAAAAAAVGIGSRGGSGTTGAMEEDMPWVSTRGVGPDGRRVEGLLYRYGKGEEVRIVCVCHGRFLSPAEFVQHAGGGDVAHPLRHIIVSPSPPSFL